MIQAENSPISWRKDRFATSKLLLIPMLGLIAGVLIATFLFYYWFDMSHQMVFSMVLPMGLYAFIANAIGLLIYWFSSIYSRSIGFNVFMTVFLAGCLTFFNGWIASQLMFVEIIVLKDVAILLIFATVIAMSFSLMAFSKTVKGLQAINLTSQMIANGDLSRRVQVMGYDEVAQLGIAFNNMAERLDISAQERAKAEQLRNDLIAWVSHDLRTPLTSIRVMVEALNDEMVTDPQEIKRYYRMMTNDIMGLNNLINDLFELAQINAGSVEMAMEVVSLADLLSDTMQSFQSLAKAQKVTLIGKIAGELGDVRLNPSKIGRLMANLIGNALKYTPTDGSITISAYQTADEAIISVSDTGTGFNTADLPHVFEKFYRGEEARSRSKGNSAGLGLSIAQGIVVAHKGRIWAENNQAGGATVSFALPL